MRNIVIILVMLMFINVIGCQEREDNRLAIEEEIDNEATELEESEGIWLTDYDQAMTVAKESDLPVLITSRVQTGAFGARSWRKKCLIRKSLRPTPKKTSCF